MKQVLLLILILASCCKCPKKAEYRPEYESDIEQLAAYYTAVIDSIKTQDTSLYNLYPFDSNIVIFDADSDPYRSYRNRGLHLHLYGLSGGDPNNCGVEVNFKYKFRVAFEDEKQYVEENLCGDSIFANSNVVKINRRTYKTDSCKKKDHITEYFFKPYMLTVWENIGFGRSAEMFYLSPFDKENPKVLYLYKL